MRLDEYEDRGWRRVSMRSADGVFLDRINDETGRLISETEWYRWEWAEVTRLGDAVSQRRYVRVRPR